MANEEHVARLARDVDEWNRWRDENRDVVPDLERAKLVGLDLRSVDLSDCVLTGANLSGSNLTHADLSRAKLDGAEFNQCTMKAVRLAYSILRSAQLNTAFLIDADLTEVDARYASFSRSYLTGARLMRSDLRNAYFRSAQFKGTDLTYADLDRANLRRVIGLDCDTLRRARNWTKTLRDPQLACGRPIPESADPSTETAPNDGDNDREDVTVSLESPGRTGDVGRLSVDVDTGVIAEVLPGPRYELVLSPEDRPIYLALERRRAAPSLRHDVTKDQQQDAARSLADSVTELTDALRNLNQPKVIGPGHNRPPISDETLDQIEAEAQTVIAQAKAPVPDLECISWFRAMLGRLSDFASRHSEALVLAVGALIAAAISKIDYFVGLFQAMP